jgi:predicted transcriptional regulator of viral defense system
MPLDDSGGVRVASVGQTFLDMLREPQYCGGISHVLEVFEEQAEQYLAVILKTLEREGNSIDKVRAGYVLHERLGLSHPTIESWKAFAQRGSSRVLVAGEPYSNIYSEAWCLSLNLPNGN